MSAGPSEGRLDAGDHRREATPAAAPPRTRQLIAADLAACTGRRGWRGVLSGFAFEPCFATLLVHRCAQHLHRNGWPRAGKLLWRWNTARSACHLHLEAELGPGLLLPHPTGVVIGSGVRVGAGVTLYQGVTLGRRQGEHYPVVAEGATVYPNAVIAGPVRIGRGAVVGAGSVVIRDVPDQAVAAGNPARLLSPRDATADRAAFPGTR
jgi:serine O-acetyltransferase